MVLGYPLPRGCVQAKVGMLSTDQPRGQKFTLLSHDLLKPWDVTRDGTPREPQGVQSGAQRLLLPGLRLGAAGAQLAGCPSFCALWGAVHPVA